MVRARRRRRSRDESAHPSAPAPDAPPSRPFPWPLALPLAVTLFWALGARGGWIYDDFPLVVNRHPPHGLGDLALSLTQTHWNNLQYYRPLARLLLTAERLALGDDPVAFRLVNAGIMGAITAAAHALLRTPSLGLSPAAALVAAALVGLHPSAAEAVFVPSGGPETLAYLPCVLGAVAAWMRPGPAMRVVALALMAAGLLFKEQAAVIPALFALVDGLGVSANAPGRDARRWTARHLPALALFAAWLALRAAVIVPAPGPRFAAFDAPGRVALSFVYALQTLLAPSPSMIYEPEFTPGAGALRTLLALALAAGLGSFARALPDGRARAARVGLGWALLAVLPTANLVPQETHFAERYALLAVPGLALAAASVWTPRWRDATALALAALCAITLSRRASFRDNETFLRQWEATDPSPYRAAGARGEEAMRHGRIAEAVTHYRRGLAIDPVRARYLHRPLAVALEELGQVEEAIAAYRAAVRANRRDEVARAALARLTSSRGP